MPNSEIARKLRKALNTLARESHPLSLASSWSTPHGPDYAYTPLGPIELSAVGPIRLIRSTAHGIGSVELDSAIVSALAYAILEDHAYDPTTGDFSASYRIGLSNGSGHYRFSYDLGKMGSADTVVQTLLGGRSALRAAMPDAVDDSNTTLAKQYQTDLIAQQGANGRTLVGAYYDNNWAHMQAFTKSNSWMKNWRGTEPTYNKGPAWLSKQIVDSHHHHTPFNRTPMFGYVSLYYHAGLKGSLSFLAKNKDSQYSEQQVKALWKAVDDSSAFDATANTNFHADTPTTTAKVMAGISTAKPPSHPDVLAYVQSEEHQHYAALGKAAIERAIKEEEAAQAQIPTAKGSYTVRIDPLTMTFTGRLVHGRTGTSKLRLRVDSAQADPGAIGVVLDPNGDRHIGKCNAVLRRASFVGMVLQRSLAGKLSGLRAQNFVANLLNKVLASA